MKTAISVPDEIFERAERLARQMKKSRSRMYSEALAEYLARHDADAVTAALNRVYAEIDPTPDEFLKAARRRGLERTEW